MKLCEVTVKLMLRYCEVNVKLCEVTVNLCETLTQTGHAGVLRCSDAARAGPNSSVAERSRVLVHAEDAPRSSQDRPITASTRRTVR